MKTLAEFRSDLKSLRDDMFNNSESMDVRLVASYLDRLVMHLEDLSETLEGMENEVDTMCKCCEGPEMMPAPAKKKAAPKKAAKKPAKKKRR
ncbi:MAG TPA: hypothetical protein VLD37_01800 [Candidatus Bilamarchaeum sp.]|nr:hypothetical protein [Candidatus Bilamarchaeum sp.]